MTPPAATATAPARVPVERRHRPVGPARPRRVSGPARPRRETAPGGSLRKRSAAPRRSRAAVGSAIVAAAIGVSEHPLLDRFVRGRAWIALVTFALLGIVTLQLALLELNGSIGRALARKSTLLRENSALSIENSALASDEHVLSAAAQAGMVPVPIKSLRFLDAHGASSTGALATLRAPVQPPATPSSETTSASAGSSEASPTGESAGSSEASSTGESAGNSASPSSSSSSSESSTSSETSQPTSSGTSSQTAEGASASSGAPVSEAGGSSAGGAAGGG